VRLRGSFAIVILCVLLTVCGVHYSSPALLDRLRAIAFDSYQQFSPRVYDPALPVRIVDIDEASLAAHGQWPWPRTDLATLVERLEALGAVAIVFDMVFPEPDRHSPAEIAKRLSGETGAAPAIDVLTKLPSTDERFAQAITRSGVVMGFVGSPVATAGPAPPLAADIEHKGDDPRLFLPSFPGAVVNLPILTQKVNGSGSINWIADQDQIIRKLPLLIQVDGKVYPSIAAEGLRLAQGIANYLIVSSGADGEASFGKRTGISRLYIGNATVPTDGNGQMWLRFTKTDPRRFIPAKSVLDGSVAKEDVNGKIVLIGTSAAGLLDIRATPLDPAVPGVEAHAQALEQMLTGDYLNRPDFADGMELMVALAMGALLGWAIFTSGAIVGLVIAVSALTAVIGFAYFGYRSWGWLIDPVLPFMTLAAVYAAGTSFLRFSVERDRNRIRHAFGRYLAPAQVEKLAADPSSLELGGEDRTLTLLFADVRGFAGHSEGMNAQQLTRFVIDLFKPLSAAILRNEGTIDKFIGDAVMAFWNAPLTDPNHAGNACQAALEMMKELDSINQARAASGGKPIAIGIGLNTGVCCVGNFGSDKRFDYSAIGNDVNLASRFESLTKFYGLPIVAGQSTAEAAAEFAMVELDLISVMGYQQPVRVFALMGDRTVRDDPDFQEIVLRQNAMLEAYRSRQFELAESRLSVMKELADPRLSKVFGIYEERIAAHKREPPPSTWDGRASASMK
jgi:adenylate cyclase